MRRRATRSVKRALKVSGGAVAAAIACAGVALGALQGAAEGRPTLVSVMLFCAVTMLAVAAVARRLRFVAPGVRAQRISPLMAAAPVLADIELALALVAGAYALFAVTGGGGSILYPVLYGVIAFTMTFLTRKAALVSVGAAYAMELALFFRTDEPLATAAHLSFIAAAAVAHALFLRGLAARQRREHERRLREEIRSRRESARDYRLIAAALGAESRPQRSRREEEEELAAGGVEAISASVLHLLDLLKSTLEARTCALLWLDDRGEYLKIKELASDSDAVTEEPRVAIVGALRAVLRDRSPLALPQTRPGQVPYYQGSPPQGAFVGVPVLEGAHVRGVLCADREAPFSERDVELCARATLQVVHAIRTEQVFSAVERAKYEHERFFQATSMLGQALTLEQVMETAFDAAALIVDYDVAVITLYERERRRHRVYSVRLKEDAPPLVSREALSGLEYRDNAGLAAMVVKNKHHLPASGELRDSTTPIFTRKIRFKSVESVLVLPLISADEAIGTFTLVSRHRHRFRKDTREMLSVIATQVAVSLQNALMYRKMETMATTDGLTGLTNHRTFQERFGQLLARAARHGHKAAVLLCDVDHFKNVNDTYGHPVGDEVLRKVAGVLQEAVRKIDITARYGGEEFVVVLEATDLDGAVNLAERIRQDVGRLEFDSEKGSFQVTMSIGVAAFPEDSKEQALLIERADHALYHAKESGRNRVISHQDFLAYQKARRAG